MLVNYSLASVFQLVHVPYFVESQNTRLEGNLKDPLVQLFLDKAWFR